MDKVYVVTSGCYSEYHVEAVFSSKEKAELYVAVHHDHNKHCSINDDEYYIEEYDISDSLINGVAYFGLNFLVHKKELNRPYCFSPVASVSPIAEEIEDLNSTNGVIKVTIPTNKYYTDDDEDIRFKIASDWCSKYLSQKLGL